jgi:hypothetical protein
LTVDLQELETAERTQSVAEVAALEAKAIEELEEMFRTFKKLEPGVKQILKRKYRAEDVLEAEGKRCVVVVSNLRCHRYIKFFQIRNFTVEQVDPYESYDTLLIAPIWVVMSLLRKTLSGRTGAFLDAVGLPDVKVKGKRSYHDMNVLADGFDELARNIARFKKMAPPGLR